MPSTVSNVFCHQGMDTHKIPVIVVDALSGSDGGELFLELCNSEGLELDDGILKNVSFNSHSGFGLRSFVGDVVSFACSAEISERELMQASAFIKKMHSGNVNSKIILQPEKKQLYRAVNPLVEMNLDDKIKVLQNTDAYLRAASPLVKQVKISLSGQWQVISIIKGDGSIVSDVRPLVRFNVLVVIEKDGRKEQGSAGHGGRSSYQNFVSELNWHKIADEALRQALVNMESIAAPAGEMTVVLGPGWPGVLLHEAIGHGLEGDFNRKKVSVYSNSMGSRIAAKGVTVVDDGAIPNKRGSLNVDDEGNASGYNVLVEDGILVQYMQDSMNAKLMNDKITGNGRRQSYRDVVMPRMTNTYMLPGEHNPEEIISSVKRGIYAVNFGGGQVDITSGKFVFSTSEGYMIENGKVTKPVKGATLIGNGFDVLKNISMIGNDTQLESGVGTCSKSGQDLPVGVGQPTLKIDAITVGGTAS